MKPEASAADLAERIGRLARVGLGFLPTPLHELPRLGRALGVRLLVKRDDLTGLALGGNKVRMLEFTMGAALAAGADCVVASAETDSNHCRQAAAAGAKVGLDVVLVLGQRHERVEWQGNLLLDHLLGARLLFVQARGAELRAAAEQHVEQLRQEGRRPFLLTLADEPRALGTISHAAGFLELTSQLRDAGESPSHIYVSSGGNTYAGLLLGARVTKADVVLVAIAPEGHRDERKKDIEMLMGRAAEILGYPRSLPDSPKLRVFDEFIGEGYGIPTKAGLEALTLSARTEGLLLDPVYTAKGMSGLIAHIRSGIVPAGSTVVFVHTGGTPGIFAASKALAPTTA